MTLMIEATYENGVFVPTQKPSFAEHERVRLTVISVDSIPAMVEMVRNRGGRRIVLDSDIANEIAQSQEFHPDGN